MAGLPARKSLEWLTKLEIAQGATELDFRRIIREAKAELSKIGLREAADIHRAIGGASFRLGHFEEALKHFEISLRLAPSPVNRVGRAISRMELGDFPGAFADLRAMTEELPEREELWANLAELFWRVGMREQAHEAFAKAAELASHGSVPSMVFMTLQAAELGLLAEVVKYATVARSLMGDEAFERLFVDERRWRKARMALERAQLLGHRLGDLNGSLQRLATQTSLDENDDERARVRAELAPLAREALRSAESE